MYGFDEESGLPEEGVVLSQNITSVSKLSDAEIDETKIQTAIDAINETRDEKIPFSPNDIQIEASPSECVYISIDDIGVKHQKNSRKTGAIREYKFIENTVAHIQYGSHSYVLTGIGMQNVFKSLLAFLLANSLLSHEIVFMTDGANNLKGYIRSLFQFHPHMVILDWFHLKKRCEERLSQSIRGKDRRNEVLEKLLRYLWVGDLSAAVSYLTSLTSEDIKNRKWLEDLLGYLNRKSYSITCYALRAKLGLRNSSNPVEKANDLLVAQRQKHNGMSWSSTGSSSLAALQMLYLNNEHNHWFRKKELHMFFHSFSNNQAA